MMVEEYCVYESYGKCTVRKDTGYLDCNQRDGAKCNAPKGFLDKLLSDEIKESKELEP